MANNDEMLEWANVYGDLKGTALKELDRIRAEGKTVLLEIDMQRVRSRKGEAFGYDCYFYPAAQHGNAVAAPANAGNGNAGVRWRRLLTARSEIACGDLFDYFIVNDDLEKAYSEERQRYCHRRKKPVKLTVRRHDAV